MSKLLTIGFHFLLLTSVLGNTTSAHTRLTCLEILSTESGPIPGEFDRSPLGGPRTVLQVLESQFKVPESLSGGNLALGTKTWGDLPASVRRILELMPHLSVAQRDALLIQVRTATAASAESKSFKYLIELGLYSRNTWIDLVSSFNDTYMTSEARLSEYYLPFLAQNMPEPLRNEVLSVLGKQYRSLKKGDETTSYGPKREVDLYFKWLLRGDLLINQEIAFGRSPSEAFEAYILEVQKYILPGDLGFRFQDIMAILRTVQRSIPKDRIDLIGMVVPRGLYVGGSVPNGRGFWGTSDLDVSSRFPFGYKARDDIERYIINQVKDLAPQTYFYTHIGREKWSLWQMLHPVVIRVTPDGLEMLVFDPRNRLDGKPKYVAYRLE